jgi:hypothetical protein
MKSKRVQLTMLMMLLLATTAFASQLWVAGEVLSSYTG